MGNYPNSQGMYSPSQSYYGSALLVEGEHTIFIVYIYMWLSHYNYV